MKQSSMMALVAAYGITLGAAAETRPNIVFVFSDDHATQAISANNTMCPKT